MKLLVAIEAYYPKSLPDLSLRWVARAGYILKLFVPKHKHGQFMAAIDEVNYQYYLDCQYDMLEDRSVKPLRYAARHGFDLLLVIPEALESWKRSKRFKPDEIACFVDAVGKARVEFGLHPKKQLKRFSNGAILYRVEALNGRTTN